MCKYGIWCVVSGGVSGLRMGWMKRDGQTLVIETEAEAIAIAAWARKSVAGFTNARFEYTAKEYN